MSACDGAAKLGENARTEAAFRGGDVHRQDDRRGAVDRHRDGEMRIIQPEAVVEPFHVVDGVDGHAAFADLAEDAVRVAVEAVERRPVERGAQAHEFLLTGEKVEAFVRVFGQSKTGEETRGFFDCRCLPLCVAWLLRVPGVLAAQIELAIGAIHEWKLAWRPFAKEEPCKFARFVRQRKCHPREPKSGRGAGGSHFLEDSVPAPKHFVSKLRVLPRPIHLLAHENLVTLDRIGDI